MKKQRVRFTVLVLCAIASAVQFEPGEVVTTDDVPEATLRELAQGDTPKVAYLDTQEFNPEAAEGAGAWETMPEPSQSATEPAGDATPGEGSAGGGGKPKRGSGGDSGS
jgi:hypothetical protein